MADFQSALEYVFADEGGFSNDKADHGGATRWGITHIDASRWLKRPVSVEEMQHLPIETAKAIYEAWYWLPLGCDQIHHDGVATCLFDIGVVRGIMVSGKYAQLICDDRGARLAVDGHMGPLTIAAVNACNPNDFIRAFAAKTEEGFRAIVAHNGSQMVFLRGWVQRARRLLSLAK